MKRPSEAGAGVVSTFIGAAVFLVFLLFSAQLLLGLYAESVVTAVAYDTAASAAGADLLGAESVARARLGPDARFEWAVDDDAVRLTVRVPRRAVLGWTRPPIVRTVRVRAERVR